MGSGSPPPPHCISNAEFWWIKIWSGPLSSILEFAVQYVQYSLNMHWHSTSICSPVLHIPDSLWGYQYACEASQLLGERMRGFSFIVGWDDLHKKNFFYKCYSKVVKCSLNPKVFFTAMLLFFASLFNLTGFNSCYFPKLFSKTYTRKNILKFLWA